MGLSKNLLAGIALSLLPTEIRSSVVTPALIEFDKPIPVTLYVDPALSVDERQTLRAIIDSLTTTIDSRFKFTTTSIYELARRPPTQFATMDSLVSTMPPTYRGYTVLVSSRGLTQNGSDLNDRGYWGIHPFHNGEPSNKMAIRVRTPLTAQNARRAANTFLHEVGHSFTDHSFSASVMRPLRTEPLGFMPAQLEGLERFQERGFYRPTKLPQPFPVTREDSSAVRFLNRANVLYTQKRFTVADALYARAAEQARDSLLVREANDSRAYIRRKHTF